MLYGCDLSHWNSDKQFNSILAEKPDFIFFKATEGVTYTDPTFKVRVRKAIEEEVAVGFYHYARPENNAIAKREAENFLKAVEEFGDKCVYVLDWEGTAERHDPIWIKKWCSFIEQKTGRRPMLYLNHSYAKNAAESLKEYPLWVAKWGTEPVGKIGHWERYAVWQYTNTPYDKNIFTGTMSEFETIGKVVSDEGADHHCGCCGYSCECCKER